MNDEKLEYRLDRMKEGAVEEMREMAIEEGYDRCPICDEEILCRKSIKGKSIIIECSYCDYREIR